MQDSLERLKERLGEVTDLKKVTRLISWDQQTMMPPAGIGHRADQSATVQRLAHELFTDPVVGVLLDELRSLEESLDPDSDDAALIRVTSRDYEKAVRVPASLRAAMARAPAATTSASRRATTPTRSSRSSRRCTSTATASTPTSCHSTSSDCRPASTARSGSTNRRAGSGRTSSAAASRSGGSSTRACRR